MSTKRLATDAMFLTLALVVSYIEVLIPVPVGIPGVKLGLANGVIMVLLFFTTWTRTLEISVIRVVLAGFLFGNPMTIAYSLAGGILSLVIMGLLKKIEGFSPIGISVGGGVAHNIGQLSVAVFLMENTKIYYYAPVLLIRVFNTSSRAVIRREAADSDFWYSMTFATSSSTTTPETWSRLSWRLLDTVEAAVWRFSAKLTSSARVDT